MTNPSALAPDTVLENNYRIVHELGRGGFARTYLAHNLRRFNEHCVLKQFAPEGTGNSAKAMELFDREAAVLYKLDHPQIPQFHEQFKARTVGGEFLFIVQDYIAGNNYWQVLAQRGRLFSEAEACQFLQQLLPVLDYIHSCGVIHRDISPDNIIQRQGDGLPVLIDFGAVREAAARYGQSQQTIVGKVGYAPEEQMRGQVRPDSDLYALAATTLVLLTGQEPDRLYNSRLARWDWEAHLKLSPELDRVLGKMLAYQPKNRYPSAAAVLQDLPTHPTSSSRTRTGGFIGGTFSQLKTLVVAPAGPKIAKTATKTREVAAGLGKPAKLVSRWVLTVLLLAGGTSWGWNWLKTQNWTAIQSPLSSWNNPDWGKTLTSWWPQDWNLTRAWPKDFDPMKSVNNAIGNMGTSGWPTIDFKGQGKVDEAAIKVKQTTVRRWLKAQGKSADRFYRQVDQVFYQKHPELKGRALQPGAPDLQLRYEWWSIAVGLTE